MIPLNESAIRVHLNSHVLQNGVNFHLFPEIDSTNLFLSHLPISTKIDICCAETQTHGRGRFGRHWHSPFGENIYCSSRWHFSSTFEAVSGLSLVVALSIVRTLAEFSIQDRIRIKWPNDILWDNKKICGILIELQRTTAHDFYAIIGIGLNVNMSQHPHPSLHHPWASLYDITQLSIDRNILIGKLMIQLFEHIHALNEHGFEYFLPRWREVDYLDRNLMTIFQGSKQHTGRGHGVDSLGRLILIDDKGLKFYFDSGETSLRT